MAFADNIHALIIARFITGIAAGMLNITIPLYLTETLPEALRGRGTVAFQLCLCFGIFFATLMSLSFESASAWRSVFLIELIPAFIVFLNIFLIPESPRWLVSRERSAQALKALERIRTNDEAKSILLILQKNTTDDHQNPLTIFRKKRFLVPCLLTMFVASLNQLTGINVFLQYDATILSMVGFETHAIALWGSLLITGINFLITCVAIFLVDKIERRSLLRIGLMGILLSLTVATLATHFLMLGHAKALIITFALLGYIASFALGPGALIWTLLSEVLPTKIRSMGLAISLCVSSLSGAVFSSVFLGLENKIGLTGIFFLCAMLSFIYGLVTFLLPATKGKSLEDIEKNFLTQPQK
jgi:sugar porter (SP) family MFS transporter